MVCLYSVAYELPERISISCSAYLTPPQQYWLLRASFSKHQNQNSILYLVRHATKWHYKMLGTSRTLHGAKDPRLSDLTATFTQDRVTQI